MNDNRRLTTILGVSQLLNWSTTFYLPAVIAGPAAGSLGITRVAAVGGFSWALLVAGACAPRIGRRIEAVGGRPVLSLGCLVIAAGLALLAAARGLPHWYIGWTVLGVGMALGLYDAAFATAGRLLGREATPVITGITLFAGFASTLGWPVGTALLPSLGWRGVLLLYAALQLGLNLPMLWFGLPAGLPAPHPQAAPPAAGARRSRSIALLCLAGFFALRWFLTSAIAVFILPLLAGIGLDLSQQLVVAALIGPGQVFGRILEWRIGPRFALLARARAGAALMPLGIVAMLSAVASPWPLQFPAACAFAVLYGMSNGIMTINRGTLPMAIFGPAGYATLLGWLAVPVLLAQAGAPMLAAPLMDVWPAARVLLLIGIVSAGAILLLAPLRLPSQPGTA